MDIQKIADEIYAGLGTLKEEFSRVKGISGIGTVIATVLTKVEDIQTKVGTLTGDEKKAVAVNVINRFVNLPFIPEWIEAKIIAAAVDWFVDFFNRSFGKMWIDRLKAVIPF